MTDDNKPDQSDAEDDWASALAEQTSAVQPAAPAAPVNPELAAAKGVTGSTANVFQSLNGTGAGTGPGMHANTHTSAGKTDIDMILDIPVELTAQLGQTRITIKNLLQLAQGSVVELDGLAGEPMDVFIYGYLIAQGEVVVVNDKFGIRLTDIITPSERIHKLNR